MIASMYATVRARSAQFYFQAVISWLGIPEGVDQLLSGATWPGFVGYFGF